jgi:hypothetical protein
VEGSSICMYSYPPVDALEGSHCMTVGGLLKGILKR